MIIALLAAFIVVALINVPGLVREKRWKDLWVYSGVYVLTLTISVLMVLGVQIPSPIMGIEYLFENVLHLSYAPA